MPKVFALHWCLQRISASETEPISPSQMDVSLAATKPYVLKVNIQTEQQTLACFKAFTSAGIHSDIKKKKNPLISPHI